MRSDIKTVDEDTALKVAAQTLLNHKYGCLPVVHDGALRGILTEADFLRLTINLMDALDKQE
jgi:CBS domain-containing protein